MQAFNVRSKKLTDSQQKTSQYRPIGVEVSANTRAAVGMGIPMGMGVGWVWGL